MYCNNSILVSDYGKVFLIITLMFCFTILQISALVEQTENISLSGKKKPKGKV